MAFQKLINTKFVQTLLYYLIRLYSSTFRFKVENEQTWLNYYLNNKGSVLLCAYHQQFFSAIRHFKKYQDYQPALMISKSKDGDIIASVAQQAGWCPVRGSSSRGGGEALELMIEHLKQYKIGAHIVDGPRGPAGKVKAGVIKFAHKAKAVLVPFYITADRAWYFNSWDRFLLPKPYARVVLHYGEMIKFEETADHDAFEEQRLALEKKMYREYAGLF